MVTYYLFIDKEFCIQNVFETLQMNILEPGIKYIRIKQHTILPAFIVVESIYKDQYLKSKIDEELTNIGYDRSFKILKPLSKNETIV
jgi:hypothetical protein